LDKVTEKKAAAHARKVAAEAKKTEKKSKPSHIIILRVGPLNLLNTVSGRGCGRGTDR
jgi:hypothetical protein